MPEIVFHTDPDGTPTLREQVDRLGWAKQEPRSGYDLDLFRVVEGLVSEVERLSREVGDLRGELDEERSERRQADSVLDAMLGAIS